MSSFIEVGCIIHIGIECCRKGLSVLHVPSHWVDSPFISTLVVSKINLNVGTGCGRLFYRYLSFRPTPSVEAVQHIYLPFKGV